MKSVSISIILCTAGRSADLQSTLKSLEEVRTPDGTQVELVLVENGKQAGARQLVSKFEARGVTVRYLHEPRRGKSNALNLGVRSSAGEILVFTDDDVRFPSDWLERLCAPFLEGDADAVAGGVRFAPHLERPWMERMHRAFLASTQDYLSSEAPSELCGANMAIRRAVFAKVPAFDPELGPGITGGGEESLFSWQLQEAGFRITPALDVEIEHHFSPTRLKYGTWKRVADSQGRIRAYQRHHWRHESMVLPEIKELWLKAKLNLRSLLHARHRSETEGIPCWELSYRWEAAECHHFLKERRRPRRYDRRGLALKHPDTDRS